ncbi:MAG: TonB-dependent receptor, partial [candidate division Zixibacteria bacterium]|nr:TonB-dependent receptor [candidate division Zixibacteria bacterium]
MKRFLLFMAALLLVEATGIHAQEQSGTEENPKELNDSIVVTANRTATPLREIGSSVTIITRAEIENSQAVMITDILRNVPGLDVVQSGGAGTLTSLFLRGANAHHTLVLLDGISLNDPSSPNNAADLSNLSTENISRIEILRGPQSVLYGPEAIGGVVQLFTKTGSENRELSFSSETGSFNTLNFKTALSGSHKKLSYSLSASFLDTDGISAADQKDGATEKDGYKNSQISSHLDFDFNTALNLRLTGRYTDSESEIDKTSGVLDDPNYVTDQKEQQYGARLIHNPANSSWHQQFSLSVTDIERNTFDTYDVDHPSDSQSTFTTGERIAISWQSSLQINRRNALTIGIESERSEFSSDLFFRSSLPDFISVIGGEHAWSRGVYIFDQAQIGEKLFLTAGARLDEHKQFGSTGTYRLTAAYLFDEIRARLRAVIGTGYKAPSIFQLYHPSPFIGNPDLLPEKSRSWEIGAEHELAAELLTFSITYFDNDYKDLIQGTENVAKAISHGIEASLEFKSHQLRTHLDYTFTRSEDKTNGEELIRRPAQKLVLVTNYQLNRNFTLNMVARHVGERDDLDFSQFPAPRVTLKSYTVVNLTASYVLSQNLQLTGRVDNLFDEDYQEVLTYGNI